MAATTVNPPLSPVTRSVQQSQGGAIRPTARPLNFGSLLTLWARGDALRVRTSILGTGAASLGAGLFVENMPVGNSDDEKGHGLAHPPQWSLRQFACVEYSVAHQRIGGGQDASTSSVTKKTCQACAYDD